MPPAKFDLFIVALTREPTVADGGSQTACFPPGQFTGRDQVLSTGV